MIISAFPATGKTTLADGNPDVLDSDSSAWSWESPGVRHPGWPDHYVTHLADSEGSHALVLCSSHAEVREALRARGAGFVLVYPQSNLRDEYVERMVKRGSPSGLVNLIDSQWYDLIDSCQKQRGCAHIRLGAGQFLSSVVLP